MLQIIHEVMGEMTMTDIQEIIKQLKVIRWVWFNNIQLYFVQLGCRLASLAGQLILKNLNLLSFVH